MNILHLLPYFIRANKTGGPALQLSRLALAEQVLGNHVQIVTTTGNLDEEIDVEFTGDVYETCENDLSIVYLRRKKNLFPPTFYYAPALSNWLKANLVQFDIVIVHGIWTYFNWMCTRMCKKLGKPYLIFVHGSLDPWAFNHHRWKKIPYWYLIENSNFNLSSGVIVLSEDEKNQVRDRGVDKPIYLAKNGLLHPVRYVGNPDELIEHQLPEIAGHPFVLFMSRLHVKKGLDILLEAWAQVSHHYPEWKLVIAGPDEDGYLKNLQNLQAGNMFFPGLVLDDFKAALLQKASLFVLPSFSEGVPGSVVEAMAYKLPVLVTPACHMPEVKAAHAGMVVEPEVRAIADGLMRMLSNSDLRREMGANAERLSRDEFDEIKIASDLVSFCQSLLDRRASLSWHAS